MQDKSTLSVKTFDVGPMLNIVYLIWDNTTKDAAIVDPAWDLTEVLNFTRQKGLKLRKILLTHSHHDHVNSIDTLLKEYDLPIYINKFEARFWKKKYDNLITNPLNSEDPNKIFYSLIDNSESLEETSNVNNSLRKSEINHINMNSKKDNFSKKLTTEEELYDEFNYLLDE